MVKSSISKVPSIKGKTAPKTAHTSNTKKGMGDFYGRATRNPLGKVLDGQGINQTSKAKLKKPPKSLA